MTTQVSAVPGFVEVEPLRIFLLDQFELPGPPPALDALLEEYSLVDLRELPVPDQLGHAVLGGEALSPFAMLPDPAGQIRCHADVERAVPSAGEDIDE